MLRARRRFWVLGAAGMALLDLLFLPMVVLSDLGAAGWGLFAICGVIALASAAMAWRPGGASIDTSGLSVTQFGVTTSYGWREVERLGVIDMPSDMTNSRRVAFGLTAEARRRRGGIWDAFRRPLLGGFDGALPGQYGMSAEQLLAVMEGFRNRPEVHH